MSYYGITLLLALAVLIASAAYNAGRVLQARIDDEAGGTEK